MTCTTQQTVATLLDKGWHPVTATVLERFGKGGLYTALVSGTTVTYIKPTGTRVVRNEV